jgi:hypothetical protein
MAKCLHILAVVVCYLVGRLTWAAQPASPDLPEPTRVTLHLNKAPVSAAFQELSAKSNYTLETKLDPGSPEPRLTLDVTDQPFWSVFREISRQTGMSFGTSYPSKITFAPNPTFATRPAADLGSFLITVTRVQQVEAMRFGGAVAADTKPTRKLTLQLVTFIDPAVPLFRYCATPEIVEATDEKGHSLAPPPPADFEANRSIDSLSWFAELPLAVLPDAGQKLHLRGILHARIFTGVETWEIPDPTKAAGATRTFSNDAKLTLQSLSSPRDNDYRLNLTIQADKKTFPYFQPSVLTTCVRLFDSQDRQLSRSFSSNPIDTKVDPPLATVTFSASSSQKPFGPPAKLILQVPAAIQDLSIPFELKDVPLP